MATEKQIAANRRNAQRSTGPATPAGKLITRLNSLKHGLAARLNVLPFESQADYDHLEQSLLAELQPQNLAHVLLVKRFAQKQWLIQRLANTETAWLNLLYEDRRLEGVAGAHQPKPALDPYEGLALTMLESRPSDPHDLLHKNFFRYRAQIENEYQRALRALERAKLLTPSLHPAHPEIGFAPEPSASLGPEMYDEQDSPCPTPPSSSASPSLAGSLRNNPHRSSPPKSTPTVASPSVSRPPKPRMPPSMETGCPSEPFRK